MNSYTALSLVAWSWFALLAVAGQLRPQTGTAPDALDPARVITNVVLGVLDLAAGLALPLALVAVAALGNFSGFGLLRWIGLGGMAGFAASLVLTDFANWFAHWLSHRWSLLWRLHRVHHCDTSLDVLTTYRHHPFETLVSGTLQAAIVAVLGLDPAGVAAYALIIAFQAPLLHANVAWPALSQLARVTRAVLMTPAQHALHHSALRSETDSNYGQFLSIWDRLAGTKLDATDARMGRLELGLGEHYRDSASGLVAQFTLPFAPIMPAVSANGLGRDPGSA